MAIRRRSTFGGPAGLCDGGIEEAGEVAVLVWYFEDGVEVDGEAPAGGRG